ncbi:hypothetical protein PVAP13_2NG061446 [Panicum virgatum]|uniref:Uncharacterized protein n=1 Tax=Panicum virgatum TaxID=38727 RepID=A0A8T0VCK3_PANVG|nr:hypothetical protein PVAP13_2NG061446 [Panicum virgatum]
MCRGWGSNPGGSQEGRREGSQGDHVRLCLHLPRRRRLHPHHAGGDLVNLADAKQRPRSESREPGKKPWRLVSSSEVPQMMKPEGPAGDDTTPSPAAGRRWRHYRR